MKFLQETARLESKANHEMDATNSPGKRIGDFTWVTPSFVIGTVVTIAILGGTGWCWMRSLEDANSFPWLLTSLVTAAAVPAAICCALWTATNYVLWIEVGEAFTFATPLGAQTVPWKSLQGIEFEVEYKTVPLIVIPFELVVGQNCIAVITLENGRTLRGRITRDEALVLHELLSEYPMLDTHFVRALSSPRATMTTFVDAVMEDDLFYASKFLDLSRFEKQAADRIAAPCARKLKEVIDSVWYIDYEEVSDEPLTPSPYCLAASSEQEVDEDMLPLLQAIKISRDSLSGFWRFDSDTVDMIVNEFLNARVAGDTGGK
jgi:hypothetical protein